MPASRYEQALEALSKLWEVPPDQLQGRMRGACNGDNELQAEVRCLLEASGNGVDCDLDTPVLGPNFNVDELLNALNVDILNFQIGRYRTTELLGQGGMGVVYKAEQDQPHRYVALKLIRPGLASPQHLRRLEYEAEVLARMHHSGIAHVYEAGTIETDQGQQPFVAMEFIDGQPITTYVESRKLSLKDRVALLIKVCEAVEYAHQQSVIHRDLKPGNILVDATGQPKIVDFGVARVTDCDVQQATLEADAGKIVGTLQYMSPEQARGNLRELDTRCDVYALGVIAYELVADHPPYDLRGKAIAEAVRIIQDCQPENLGTIDPAFRGDIEIIVGKAMEKDKEARYATVAHLAADFRHWLCEEPIVARAHSTGYLLLKFAKRNKLLVGSAVVVLTTLGLGILGLSIGLHQARITQRAASASAGEAILSRRAAELRLARQLIAQGDSHLVALETDHAREAFDEARSIFQNLGESSVSADLALVDVYRLDPTPLLSWDVHKRAFCGLILPDNRHAVTTQKDTTVCLWNLLTGHLESQFLGLTAPGRPLAISPDGRRLMAGGEDGLIVVWDIASRSPIASLRGHTGAVSAISFSPDGGTILSGGEDKSVRLWDLASGRQLQFWNDHAAAVRASVFLNNGSEIATGDAVGEILVRSLADGALHYRLHRSKPEHDMTGPDIVSNMSVSPDGKILASCGNKEGEIRLWNWANGEYLGSLTGHEHRVHTAQFSPDGSRMISCGDDGTIRIWDVASRREIRRFNDNTDSHFAPVFVSVALDGRSVLVTGTGGNFKVWSLADSPVLRYLTKNSADALDVGLSPDGRLLVAEGAIHDLKVWDIATGCVIIEAHNFNSRPVAVAFTPDGDHVLAVAGSDTSGSRFLWKWDFHETDEPRKYSIDPGSAVIPLPDNTSALIGDGLAGALRIWNLNTGEFSRILPRDAVISRGLSVTQDGKTALVHRSDGSVEQWDLPAGRMIRKMDGFATQVTSAVGISPDGRMALCGREGFAVLLWDLQTGKPLRTFLGHTNVVDETLFSSDGRWVVSPGWDKTIRIWDVRTGEELRIFRGHEAAVYRAILTSDRRTMISTSLDRSIRIWDLAAPEIYAAFEPKVSPSLAALAANPDQPTALRDLGRWYSFRGFDDWAVEMFEAARAQGAVISHLTIGRCLWRLGRMTEAAAEFRLAMREEEAPASYLQVCISAIESPTPSTTQPAQ